MSCEGKRHVTQVCFSQTQTKRSLTQSAGVPETMSHAKCTQSPGDLVCLCVCAPVSLSMLSAHDGVTCRNLEKCHHQHLSGRVPSGQDQEYKAQKVTVSSWKPKSEFFAAKLLPGTSLKKKRTVRQRTGRRTSTCSMLRQGVLCHGPCSRQRVTAEFSNN